MAPFLDLASIAIIGLEVTALPFFLASCFDRLWLVFAVCLGYQVIMREGFNLDGQWPYIPAEEHDSRLVFNAVYGILMFAFAFLGKFSVYWLNLKPLVCLFSVFPKDLNFLYRLNDEQVKQPTIVAIIMLIWVVFCALLQYLPYKMFMNQWVINGNESPWRIIAVIYGLFIPFVFCTLIFILCLLALWGVATFFSKSRKGNNRILTWLTDQCNPSMYKLAQNSGGTKEVHLNFFLRMIVKTVLCIMFVTFLIHVYITLVLTWTDTQNVNWVALGSVVLWVALFVAIFLFGLIFQYWIDPYIFSWGNKAVDIESGDNEALTEQDREEQEQGGEGEGEEGGEEKKEETKSKYNSTSSGSGLNIKTYFPNNKQKDYVY